MAGLRQWDILPISPTQVPPATPRLFSSPPPGLGDAWALAHPSGRCERIHTFPEHCGERSRHWCIKTAQSWLSQRPCPRPQLKTAMQLKALAAPPSHTEPGAPACPPTTHEMRRSVRNTHGSPVGALGSWSDPGFNSATRSWTNHKL